ncbi:alpha-ribazole phosphatase family protein [Puniceibacterium sp. IMCC21224]|uniref:alpha-ribazole phosphatase family protein n=1 Tax=Puniceibacterium sp. IMCC21224 TaxID=1618204 RepID=UPI00065D293E|nr:alpha-ribazole phosphatase family protein [Puniceibacterium sp. IMCC21224]KMK67340.1 fructose-2,6-bisphosphatase [Puniceibacterium sp. IMCC21224]
MALTLLRHTRPAGAEGLCYGRSDLVLTDTFESECAAILDRLAPSEVVITSPLQRCRLLAELIAAHWSVPLIVDDDWIEMNFGRWETVPWDHIPRTELDAWAADFYDYDGHGGETVRHLERRVTSALSKVPQDALIVTHAGVIKAALAHHGRPDAWQHRTGYGVALRLD